MKNSDHNQTSDLALLADYPEASSIGKLVKLYSLFLESANVVSTVTTALKKYLAQGRISLQVLKEQAMEIEKVIGVLGGITLTIEPPTNEIAIAQEIIEKLHLNKPGEINYLGNRIHTLVTEVSTSYKDKNLNFCLNHLKEKAWKLLEGLIEYAEMEYNSSLNL